MKALETIDAFPARVTERIRYSDTDRQGHVNNVLFAFFFEAGRVDVLFMRGDEPPEHCLYVLARSTIDFLGELQWPGEVEIGTRFAHVGTSSITIRQALFQKGLCAGTSDSVMVLIDKRTRKPHPLPGPTRAHFARLSGAAAE